jgi:hypothetical protein
LSIPAENQDGGFERFAWPIRLSPLLVALLLAALWLAGTPSPVPDLRLSAPVVARPGSSIGIRAWQLDIDDAGYPIVRAPEIEVELHDERGVVLAKTRLLASALEGAEGGLAIGADVRGKLSLRATASIDGEPVRVDRTLYVREGIDSKLPAGRSVNAFQTYELEPLRVIDSTRAPPTIDPRVEEGACAPDVPCTMIVWLGDWDGRVRARALGGVRFEDSVVRSSAGFARFSLRPVGQEALAIVDALGDDGAVLASRRVRLPLVPGALVARASRDAGAVKLGWNALGDPQSVLVDVFDGHRWVSATSLSQSDPEIQLPGPGVWRIQARSELYADNTAGVSFVVVDAPGGVGALRRAAEFVVRDAGQTGLDPLAMSVLEDGFAANPDDALRALFAIPSFDLVSVGAGMSSSVAPDAGLDARQDRRRWFAAGLILLVGLVVSMVLFRVERFARLRATHLLQSLDDAPAPRASWSGRGLWAFVLLVFVLMAVLALSKRWF